LALRLTGQVSIDGWGRARPPSRLAFASGVARAAEGRTFPPVHQCPAARGADCL